MDIDDGVGVGQKCFKYRVGRGCEVEVGSVKSVQMVSLRRWLNVDGGGGQVKSVKSVPNIRIYHHYSLL